MLVFCLMFVPDEKTKVEYIPSLTDVKVRSLIEWAIECTLLGQLDSMRQAGALACPSDFNLWTGQGKTLARAFALHLKENWLGETFHS